MKALLQTLAERGTLVSPEAASLISTAEAGVEAVAKALLSARELPFYLTAADVGRLVEPRPADAPPVPRRVQVASPAPPPPPPPDEPPGFAAVEADPEDLDEPPAVPARAPTPPPVAAAEAVASAEPVLPRAAASPPPAPFTPDTRGGGALLASGSGSHLLLEPPESDRGSVALAAAQRARPGERPKGEPYAHRAEVLLDVTGNSTCEGALSDFTKYFTDRLGRIRKILKNRRELYGFLPIRNLRAGAQAEVKIVGIVTDVRTTKNGHRLIEIEDETGTVNVLAPANSPHLVSEADTVIEDEVLGIVAKPAARGELLILERVVRPDVPVQGPGNRSSAPSAVAIVSDLHFGSKTFLEEDWERFVRWINGESGDASARAIARKVKYLVVNGDIVDGIGIFPGQEDELSIPDGKGQYERAANELRRIRDDVKIYTLPGNHDLVRPAEPQPAIPDKYRKLFDAGVVHLGNPVKLSIEGVELLSYHGRSMDDWITRVSGLSYEKPIDAMREMIQRRHVCPVYGLRTPVAPEHRDYLVIDTVPDVFVTGHVHSAGLDVYRGVTLVNASCWQSQTAYQKMHGFVPDPGKVPIVELDTLRTFFMDFHRGSAGIDRVGRSALGKPDAAVKPEF